MVSVADAVDLSRLHPDELSMAERVALLPGPDRDEFLGSLSEEAAASLEYDWEFWGRPDQQPPPGDWRLWIISEGRGAGKTRTGTEWNRTKVKAQAELPRAERGKGEALWVGATASDVRDLMVEGPSGILRVCPKWERPDYEPSKRQLVFPNGYIIRLRTAEEPDGIRGPSVDWAWADELAKWTYLQAAWDNLRFCLREGINPQTLVTTTPRPLELLMKLMGQNPGTGMPQEPLIRGTVVAPRVSTFRNAANLAPEYLQEMVDTYAHTRLGRQELFAEVLLDVEGALWTFDMIARKRITWAQYETLVADALQRVVTGVDPAGSTKDGADDTGIVTAGRSGRSCPVCRNKDGRAHFFVLADRTCHEAPAGWAARAIAAHDEFEGDRIVGEKNFGGDMVEATIRSVDPTVPFKAVTASRGKAVRAEPISALYEKDRVHHVGVYTELEYEQTHWEPDTGQRSPNRMDGLVWALTELSGSKTVGKGRSSGKALANAQLPNAVGFR